MPVKVNVYYHEGLSRAYATAQAASVASDSVAAVQHPYLSRECVECSGAEPVCTDSQRAGPGTVLARIEVEAGKSVHFEVNPQNRKVSADAGSPRLSGEAVVNFGPGWSLSFAEAPQQ